MYNTGHFFDSFDFFDRSSSCFQDYRAKKSKKCSILLGQFKKHIDFWEGEGGGGSAFFQNAPIISSTILNFFAL